MSETEHIITSTIWVKGTPAIRFNASQIEYVRVHPDNDVIEVRTPEFTFSTNPRMIDVQHADIRTVINP